jgi:hypothetical protein
MKTSTFHLFSLFFEKKVDIPKKHQLKASTFDKFFDEII